MNQTIILASDHAGFKLKESVKKFLRENGYKIEDVGANELTAGDDYPIFMRDAAKRVAADQSGNARAIIFGKSGEGEAMEANRFRAVRAAVWYGGNTEVLELSRKHNDANVLSIGAGFVSEDEAKKAVSLWLATAFSNEERHRRRIKEIDEIN